MKQRISSISKWTCFVLICSCVTYKPAPEVYEPSCLDRLLEIGEFHALIRYFNDGNLTPGVCAGVFDFRFATPEAAEEYNAYVLESFDRKETLRFYAKIKISGYNNGELRDELIVSHLKIAHDVNHQERSPKSAN